MNTYSYNKNDTDKALSDDQAAELAQIFSALSDANRLRIISLLADGERNVSDLAEQVKLSESATSHQLRTLRQMRLVRTRKEGRQVFYTLDDEHVKSLYLLGLEHILHSR